MKMFADPNWAASFTTILLPAKMSNYFLCLSKHIFREHDGIVVKPECDSHGTLRKKKWELMEIWKGIKVSHSSYLHASTVTCQCGIKALWWEHKLISWDWHTCCSWTRNTFLLLVSQVLMGRVAGAQKSRLWADEAFFVVIPFLPKFHRASEAEIHWPAQRVRVANVSSRPGLSVGGLQSGSWKISIISHLHSHKKHHTRNAQQTTRNDPSRNILILCKINFDGCRFKRGSTRQPRLGEKARKFNYFYRSRVFRKAKQ